MDKSISGSSKEAKIRAPQSQSSFTLENILGENHEGLEHPGLKQRETANSSTVAEGWDEESADATTAEGYCVECEGGSSCMVH